MSTGKQIANYRKKLGWTLAQLSERCGVDIGTISALENRASMRSKFFGPIASAFGLSIEQLLDDSREYTPTPPPMGASDEPKIYKVTPPANWPFKTVYPADWRKLDDRQKDKVEGFVLGMLSNIEHTQESPERRANL